MGGRGRGEGGKGTGEGGRGTGEGGTGGGGRGRGEGGRGTFPQQLPFQVVQLLLGKATPTVGKEEV